MNYYKVNTFEDIASRLCHGRTPAQTDVSLFGKWARSEMTLGECKKRFMSHNMFEDVLDVDDDLFIQYMNRLGYYRDGERYF